MIQYEWLTFKETAEGMTNEIYGENAQEEERVKVNSSMRNYMLGLNFFW